MKSIETIKKYEKHPEEILSHSYFIQNTESFYKYYKDFMVHKDVKSDDAHIANYFR